MTIGNMRPLCGLVGALLLTACASRAVEGEPGGPSLVRDFEALSLPEKVDVLGELRAELDRELLTPHPELLLEHEALVNAEGVSVNRVLNRGPFDGVTLVRGGGAYYSFTSRTNDYNQGPDLELQQWCFSSGFYGHNWGHVVRLDAESLLEVGLDDVPEELRAEVAPPRARPSKRQTQVGAVHAVRSIRQGESDLLVALEVLQRDEHGVTFAWRILEEFTVPERDR